MQELLVFQSLWAMEQRSAKRPELSLQENVEKIARGGFGASARDGMIVNM